MRRSIMLTVASRLRQAASGSSTRSMKCAAWIACSIGNLISLNDHYTAARIQTANQHHRQCRWHEDGPLKGPWTKVGFIPVVIDTGPTDFTPGGPLKPHGRRSLGLERLGDPLASGAFPSRPHVRLMSVEKPEAHTI